MISVLIFGDVIGSIGRRGITLALPTLRETWKPDLVIANVENLAHGRGITPRTLSELDRAGVDAYTGGNHTWHNPIGYPCFDDPVWKGRMIRPANILQARAGVGTMTLRLGDIRIQVINLLGQMLMKEEVENPFTAFDRLVDPTANAVILDFHAEATSEKEALGHYLDGRASLVYGTHTHVPTTDHKILSGGTAYTTDIGRNGGHDTVVGFEKTAAVRKFLNAGAKAYDPPEQGPTDINAILVTIDEETGHAQSIHRIREIVVV